MRDLIVDGRLAPGAPLTESTLAAQLGMSRTPVHCALRRLEHEGYLSQLTSGSRRLIVAPLTRDDARQLFAILVRIEALAARWTAGLTTDRRCAAVGRLRAVNRALDHCRDLASAQQRDRILQLNARFHRVLVQSAGRQRLLAVHEATRPQWERYVRLYVARLEKELDGSVARHESAAAAIEAGDASAAMTAIRADWRHGARRLGAMIDAVGERGTWP